MLHPSHDRLLPRPQVLQGPRPAGDERPIRCQDHQHRRQVGHHGACHLEGTCQAVHATSRVHCELFFKFTLHLHVHDIATMFWGISLCFSRLALLRRRIQTSCWSPSNRKPPQSTCVVCACTNSFRRSPSVDRCRRERRWTRSTTSTMWIVLETQCAMVRVLK